MSVAARVGRRPPGPTPPAGRPWSFIGPPCQSLDQQATAPSWADGTLRLGIRDHAGFRTRPVGRSLAVPDAAGRTARPCPGNSAYGAISNQGRRTNARRWARGGAGQLGVIAAYFGCCLLPHRDDVDVQERGPNRRAGSRTRPAARSSAWSARTQPAAIARNLRRDEQHQALRPRRLVGDSPHGGDSYTSGTIWDGVCQTIHGVMQATEAIAQVAAQRQHRRGHPRSRLIVTVTSW